MYKNIRKYSHPGFKLINQNATHQNGHCQKTIAPTLKVKPMIRKNNGQGLIEYLILVALIAVTTIGVVKVVGNNMATQYENINRAMGARNSQKLTITNASESSLKQKDLSNFMDNSRLSK